MDTIKLNYQSSTSQSYWKMVNEVIIVVTDHTLQELAIENY